MKATKLWVICGVLLVAALVTLAVWPPGNDSGYVPQSPAASDYDREVSKLTKRYADQLDALQGSPDAEAKEHLILQRRFDEVNALRVRHGREPYRKIP